MALGGVSGFLNTKNVNADSAEILSDPTSAIHGFNIDEEDFDVKWKTDKFNVSYNSVGCGSATIHLGGVSMKEQSDGAYIYGVLIHAVMTPKEFELTGDGNTKSYRGRSRYLKLSSTRSNNQELISNSPENVSGTSSYTVGVSASKNENGSSYAISANTTITKNALEVMNTSKSSDGIFAMNYTYIRHVFPWEWERTKYCWFESVQRAAFFFTSTTPVPSASVRVEATFAIDSGSIGMWNLEMGYEITNYKYVSVTF